jgi:hypothetical protein
VEAPNFPAVRARIELTQRVTSLGSLRSSQFGRLVAVKGTIVRISNIRPVNTWLAFQCLVCLRYGYIFFFVKLSIESHTGTVYFHVLLLKPTLLLWIRYN